MNTNNDFSFINDVPPPRPPPDRRAMTMIYAVPDETLDELEGEEVLITVRTILEAIRMNLGR